MASRRQADPRVPPSDQLSGGVSVPRARRSSAGKRSMSARSEASAKSAARLTPIKALKTEAFATPHTAPQPPLGVDIEVKAEKLREAVAQGTLESQLARAQEGGGDAGQGEAATAAQADTEREACRVTRRAPPSRALEPAGAERMPPPSRKQEKEELGAPVMEETRIPEPARAGDEGAAAEAAAQAAPENVEPVVELPSSSGEYEGSREIDPAAATSAAGWVFEFVAASAEILCMEMYEEIGDQGHSDEDDWAIVRSGVPSDITHAEREEEDWWAHVVPSDFADAERQEDDAWRNHMAVGGQIEEGLSRVVDLFSQVYHNASNQLLSMSREKNERLTRLHSRAHWLDSYNATLATRLEEADARAEQVIPLEARIHELEQELARATGERNAQRAAADQKAQEAEAREAELWQARAALEQKEQALEAKEAELQRKETELHQLKKAVANETAAKEAANTAFTVVHDEYAELERTAVAVYQELEGANAQSDKLLQGILRS
ncbi:uncharacterized protein LOC120675093 [Panicum virgatum]|uniref:uncharacterized protein LOC120675093 n=1 Tax=Panicum virgatum TaxID=38727 RepID=UPI0019D52DC5|nr:uncharacterized protein LOC120675093 [Panicum virgatum]